MADFQEHLTRVAHVPERNVPYYAGRLHRAYELAEGRLGEPLSPELEQMALAKLQQHCQDWQVRQARHALRLYRHLQALQQTESQASSGGRDSAAWEDLSAKVRRVMRLQHKSLQTEKSYLGWLRRFGVFTNTKPPPEVNNEDLTRFLSSLAVEGRVSVATQKQVLNALVFTFRHGLERDPGTLTDEPALVMTQCLTVG